MSLDVVFSSSDLIDQHLFAKAIRWAEQNPDDLVFWFRREPLSSVPSLDIDWSTKISELKRIRFIYAESTRRILLGCVKYTKSRSDDVASVIVSCPNDVDSITFGSILAHLRDMSRKMHTRLVVSVNMNLQIDLLHRLQMISSMYADRILEFNGSDFVDLGLLQVS